MALITIARVHGYSGMLLLLADLSARGIPAFNLDDHVSTIQPSMTVAIGGGRLAVHEDNVGEALDVLEGYRSFSETRMKIRTKVFIVAMSLIFGVMPVPPNAIYIRRIVPKTQVLEQA